MTEHRRREPAPGIFRLVLPLPFPGLDRVNAYLMPDGENFTLVDCGIYDSAKEDGGWADLVGALEVCDAAPEKISRLIVTHPHIDHYGWAAALVERFGCDLWMHEASDEELQMYEDPETIIERLREMLADHGVDPSEVEDLTAFEDWRAYLSGIVRPTTPVRGDETFTVGERTWQVVYTPGHSRSHICLWTADERILISGDHLLPSITPHIDFRRGMDTDPLGEFLDSLHKIEKLDPALVLPGHGRPFDDGAERARVNARHHDRRLGSILQIIRREPHTATEITEEIWGSTLLNFQKRLALGEALAHLAYLVHRGEVERVERDGVIAYKKVDRRSK
ncbi:MAG TPA: MBL fold metallo-hydrolase [Actinomycetota bacterium]|nr:MBL fold metallo-hydrolase [Actinomycetota bacterium]